MRGFTWIFYISYLVLGVSQELRTNEQDDLPVAASTLETAAGTEKKDDVTMAASTLETAAGTEKDDVTMAAGTEKKVDNKINEPVAVAVDARGGFSSDKLTLIQNAQSVLLEAVQYADPDVDWKKVGDEIEKWGNEVKNQGYGALIGFAVVEFLIGLGIYMWCCYGMRHREPGEQAYDFEPVPICSCCKSCKICIATMCCHPFMWANTVAKQGYMTMPFAVLIQFMLALLGAVTMGPAWLVLCLLRCYYRRQIRLEYKQDPNNCNDCCMHFCCSSCAVQQEAEYVELKKPVDDPAESALLQNQDEGPGEDTGNQEATN